MPVVSIKSGTIFAFCIHERGAAAFFFIVIRKKNDLFIPEDKSQESVSAGALPDDDFMHKLKSEAGVAKHTRRHCGRTRTRR